MPPLCAFGRLPQYGGPPISTFSVLGPALELGSCGTAAGSFDAAAGSCAEMGFCTERGSCVALGACAKPLDSAALEGTASDAALALGSASGSTSRRPTPESLCLWPRGSAG